MTVFPSLSSDGYIKDRGVILTKVMNNFLTSYKSQSNEYPVHSFKHIITNYEQGVDIAYAIETALEEMYSIYFDSVDVKVDFTNNNKENMYIYTIYVLAWYNDLRYTLNKSVTENLIIAE